ncbi:MAG: anaerobic ribonucleoside-triphosphate reductase activating protein [Burkholderiales bacterium]|nr:anaerobic ribonucleoside-triphosphate reductase activating protein [Burkholderiales bacterium]
MGGLTRFTSLDFPGRLAAVVFVQGCPWRCVYCHNPHLQPRAGAAGPPWPDVLAWLGQRRGLLDGVVFSGGEPTADPALARVVADVRALGYEVGLHSAGLYPARLQALLPRLDWVGLDVKAALGAGGRPDRTGSAHAQPYARITGVAASAAPVQRSLQALLQHRALRGSGFGYECRTTVHPALHSEAELLRLAEELAAAGVEHWVLQIARTQGVRQPLPAVGAGYPSAATLAMLQARLPGLTVRRDPT